MGTLPASQRALRDRCGHPAGGFVPFPRTALDGTLAERFHAQVTRQPDRLAVKTREHELTYAALDRAARGVAARLAAEKGDPAAPVAILLEQGAPAVWAALGGLQAGRLCVVLDPTHPPERIAHILQDSGAGIVVTDRRYARAAQGWGSSVLLVDEIAPRDAEPPVAGAPRADAPAWLLYTSGTTGPPKGVVHTSRSLLHFAMNYTNALRIAPEDRLIGTRPMSVIGGVRDVLAALLNGAAVFPFDVRREGLAGLAAWVRAYGLTIAFLTSPLFRAFAETLDGPWSLPSVRALRLGSDTVHLADVELYRRHLPATCLLINGLGGTETGTICKFFMDKDSVLPHATVPIGYGLDDMTPLVLGEDGREAAPGEVGELAVRSRYLALGYWRRPDLTERVFRPDPAGGDERVYLTGNRARRHPDGCVEHLGRRDLQTKVRGFRVELSEVETALLGVDGIREAVVVARPDAAGERGLVAYVVLEASPGPTPGALRRALAGRLPEHMIPSRIVALDAMPLTPNGKVDRAALPAHTRMRPALDVEFMAPRTPFERIVADIWADALGLDRVGVLDPFLELGGDSLLAARIVGRVIAALPVTVPAPALLGATTVEEMALTVVERALEERE